MPARKAICLDLLKAQRQATAVAAYHAHLAEQPLPNG
jgi:hypothetical protein